MSQQCGEHGQTVPGACDSRVFCEPEPRFHYVVEITMSKPTKDTVAQLAKALCQASDDPVLVVSAFAEALHQRGVASCPDDMNDWEVLADVIADVVAPDATPCPEIDDAVEQILRDAGAITVH